MTGTSCTTVALTIDIDWAPDFVIDWVASRLIERQARATWFVTHASAAVERLREYSDLFELGIHPNFLPGSSHGATAAAVLDYCMRLVPDAVSMRTHALVQSTPIFATVLRQTPIRTDVSLFLPGTPHLRPSTLRLNGSGLLRVPYCWEDDLEMESLDPCWSVAATLAMPGLKVFDFHPIHVYLNSADMGPYRSLKAACPRLDAACADDVDCFAFQGDGTRTAFLELADRIGGAGTPLIREIR